MAKTSRVMALDIGAAGIKLAEFAYGAANTVTLLAFDYREYPEELTEDTRGFIIGTVLREMLQSGRYEAKKALISISGQYALTRFVPLPPVAEEESRVRQIVEFEARQNVPFPMEEVIWDYQLIANPDAEELEVMFVVIKNDIVEDITGAVQAAGLEPVLVDVAPAACYNAARANLIGDDGCAMILNLGDRSTNLLFADRQQFFARTIPIAGHSITQQISKEFSMDFARAEELKRRHGFVALGGAYAEPESEVAASVSKIVRNVMTRLHGEINRSIGVYRAQQKGAKPNKLYLTGGSSTMGFTDRFFEDKLGIPVEYFNPFQCVQLGPQIDTQRLENMAHMFSEVVGLGLRYRGQCAVEVSLMPESLVRQIAMRRRKPYLMAAAACVLLMLLVAVLAFSQKRQVYEDLARRNASVKDKLEETRRDIRRAIEATDRNLGDYRFLEQLLAGREQLPEVLNVIESLKPQDVWLVSVKPVLGVAGAAAEPSRGGMAMEPFGGPMGFAGGGFGMGEAPTSAAQAAKIEVEKITISGFILEGHSAFVIRPDAVSVLAPAGGAAPASTGEAVAVPAGEAVAVPPPPTDPGEPAPAFGLPVAADQSEAMPAGEGSEEEGLYPEEFFERQLARHPLFDPAKTSIISYKAGAGIQNLKSFTMQVTLREPLETKYQK